MADNPWITPMLVGKGMFFDVTNDFQYPEFVEFQLTFGIENVVLPRGDIVSSLLIPMSQPITGRLGFRALHGTMLASLTGGTSAAGTVKWVEREAITVPSGAPYTVTLANTPARTDAMQVISQDGRLFRQVVAVGTNTGEYQISGTTMTFVAGDAGKALDVSYYKTVASVGETITVAPDDLPGAFQLYGSLRAYDPYGRAYYTDGVGVSLNNCRRNGDFGVGATNPEVAPVGFDFLVENLVTGDVVVYTPST